jgi:predicted nucleic acid-binding protein
MGLNQPLVYLDACAVIYFVEAHPQFGQAITQALELAKAKQIAISPLVEMECLIIPLRENNAALVQRYEIFFEQYICLDMPSEVYRRAAVLRARHNLKAPDALYLATAQYHGCTEFWTNDNRLNNAAGSLAVNILSHRPQITK